MTETTSKDMGCWPVYTIANGHRCLKGLKFHNPIEVTPQLADGFKLLLKPENPGKSSPELDELNEFSLKFAKDFAEPSKSFFLSADESPRAAKEFCGSKENSKPAPTLPRLNVEGRRSRHVYAVRTMSLNDEPEVFAFPCGTVRTKWLEKQKGFIAFPISSLEARRLIYFQSSTVMIGEDERYKLTVRDDTSGQRGEIFSVRGEVIHRAAV
jgi:hypothetical protein